MWNFLRESNNILLLAPRRVGKTSLMEAMKQQASARGYKAAFLDLSSVGSEANFVLKLLQIIDDPTILKRIAESDVGRLFQQSVKKISIAGQSIELGTFEEKDWRTIAERSAQILAGSETPWLFLVDEFPIFINHLRKSDTNRARLFLEWFRSLRHAARGVRWFLAGSIGLDKVARDAQMSDTINDLHPVREFGPFTLPVAHAFIQELGIQSHFIVPDGVRERLVEKVGWPIPFHLRLLFDRHRDYCQDQQMDPSMETLDAAYDKLILDRAPHMNWWDERLTDLYGDKADRHARTILRTAAKADSGTSLATFKSATKKNRAPGDDAEEHDRLVHDLLDALVSDGYLRIETGARTNRYVFLSPLLRDYWLRFKTR